MSDGRSVLRLDGGKQMTGGQGVGVYCHTEARPLQRRLAALDEVGADFAIVAAGPEGLVEGSERVAPETELLMVAPGAVQRLGAATRLFVVVEPASLPKELGAAHVRCIGPRRAEWTAAPDEAKALAFANDDFGLIIEPQGESGVRVRWLNRTASYLFPEVTTREVFELTPQRAVGDSKPWLIAGHVMKTSAHPASRPSAPRTYAERSAALTGRRLASDRPRPATGARHIDRPTRP